jgi:hypothetical protein
MDETTPEFLVCRQRRRENLERYLSLKPLIPGSEDNRHAPLAYRLLEAVPSDPRADGKAGQEPADSGFVIPHHTSSPRERPLLRIPLYGKDSRPFRQGHHG